jgi:Kinesin motor domain
MQTTCHPGSGPVVFVLSSWSLTTNGYDSLCSPIIPTHLSMHNFTQSFGAGQSGRTHTMYGGTVASTNRFEPGLTQLFVHQLLQHVKRAEQRQNSTPSREHIQYTVAMTYVELVEEKPIDLCFWKR